MSRRDGPKIKTQTWRQVTTLRPHELVELARNSQDLAATMDDSEDGAKATKVLRELYRVARREIAFMLDEGQRS